MRFANRRQAGQLLAAELKRLRATESWVDPLVLALPRGGVPVAAEVARALDLPLDVLVARKIGVPGEPEVGIGAIAGQDPPLSDRRPLKLLDLTPEDLAAEVARERKELHRRESLYRQARPQPVLHDRTVVVIDDGLATGVTARAALRRIRTDSPARLIFAVPVCASRAADELRQEADVFLCLQPIRYLHAVGVWYADFRQVSDRDPGPQKRRPPEAGSSRLRPPPRGCHELTHKAAKGQGRADCRRAVNVGPAGMSSPRVLGSRSRGGAQCAEWDWAPRPGRRGSRRCATALQEHSQIHHARGVWVFPVGRAGWASDFAHPGASLEGPFFAGSQGRSSA